MNLQQLAIWVGQWLLIEVSKKWPKVGTWIAENAPAVAAVLATIVTFLQGLFAPHAAMAQAADSLLASDSLAVVKTVVPVYVASGLLGWLGNFTGAILADNVLRKIVWHYILGKLLKLKAAQPDHLHLDSKGKVVK